MISAHESINAYLDKCSKSDVILPNGSRFICHLKHDQELRYLHKVYPALNDFDIGIVKLHLGFEPPEEYRNFLLFCGGATLFDASMYIYGFDSNISRSISLENQKPIYIGSSQDDFKYEYADLYENFWRPVGSIGLYETVWILINKSGRSRIIRGSDRLDFPSFDSMIAYLLSTLYSGMGCGPAREGGDQELEDALFSMTRPA